MIKQENNSADIAFVVIGFDGYSDLWNDYFYLLNKFWSNRAYKFYLVNNTLEKKYENVETINCGNDAEWSRKVQVALRKIKSKYVCLLLEDFFISDFVQNKDIENLVELMEKDDLRYCKLQNSSKIKSEKYKKFDYIRKIPADLLYGVSLQPSIWRRDYLSELIGLENYNAWVFEYARVKESKNASKDFLVGCIYDERNILKIEHGVVQGKYLPTAIECFDSIGYKLNTKNRSVMSKKEFKQLVLKRKGKELMPIWSHVIVKKIMNLFGMTFVSDRENK